MISKQKLMFKRALGCCLCVLMSFVLMFFTCMAAFMYYFVWQKTVLLSTTSYSGYNVEVIKKGNRFIGMDYEMIFIEVDDTSICRLRVNVYSERSVSCLEDSEDQFTIGFLTGDKISFTSDFSTIKYVSGHDFEVIDDNIRVIKDDTE